ncbi:hypothetical protein ACFQDF_02665 [Ectobacillus funiculus]
MGILGWLKKKKLQSSQNHEPQLCSRQDDAKYNQLTGHFHDDIKQLKGIFDRSSDIVFYEFRLSGIQRECLFV